MRELANEADHEHRLSRAGVSFYLEQSTWRTIRSGTIRSAVVPVCERCILSTRPQKSAPESEAKSVGADGMDLI